ncbi:hypothetical protein PVAP13_4KG086466 [Panicum virgatum]|uniref:SWIM-type domain-containing protein n=1 Tax=Panicum virgatum TaxID=38727 RepID=A0A8T0TL38_PANVG|nr:hypothetical protein PVAP13_4KG086466 [Panicum virgatum]
MAELNKETPQVGLRFKSADEAWQFWLAYGGRTGFDVRKRYSNGSPFDGKVTSCRFVCSNEGLRRKGQTNRATKCFRAETRTDCKARISLILDRVARNYEVNDVRKISELQAFEIETADDSRIRPKATHELASRQVGGPLNLSYTCRDRKNYLQSKRQRDLAFGQAGNCEEHITNIFWADAKMILDYAHFGDVVTFDTTFDTNKEYRPFGVFLGLNQFRETTTFIAAHNGKQPRTIFTDQDAAMGKAILKVFTESYHGLCTFHIMQNVVKHLSSAKDQDGGTEEGEEGEGEGEGEDEESHILSDFSACMYGYEDKVEFQEAFDIMRTKVKEKWAECFMRDVFSLGVRSTQLSESFNNALKNHLKSDFDIVHFLKHFERTVEDKRAKELEFEFEARKKIPRRQMHTPMLLQASEVEYERSMAACSRLLDENKYAIAIGRFHGDLHFEEERIVIGDPLNQTASCSCGMFNRTRILCAHGLKVLDLMNIKILATHYVLKRWTKAARNGSVQDKEGRNVIANPKLESQLRYKNMSHKFHNLAYKVAHSPECCLMVENALDCLGTQLEEKLNQGDELLSAAQLKKKEAKSKNSRRKRTWLDKFNKRKHKPTKKGRKKQKESGVQPQVEVENGCSKGTSVEPQECNFIDSFDSVTQLLTAPTYDDAILEDHDLF